MRCLARSGAGHIPRTPTPRRGGLGEPPWRWLVPARSPRRDTGRSGAPGGSPERSLRHRGLPGRPAEATCCHSVGRSEPCQDSGCLTNPSAWSSIRPEPGPATQLSDSSGPGANSMRTMRPGPGPAARARAYRSFSSRLSSAMRGPGVGADGRPQRGRAEAATPRWPRGAGPGSVLLPRWNDAAYAAAWIIHVSYSPGDQVNVAMRHRLSSGLAGVDSNVEALNPPLLLLCAGPRGHPGVLAFTSARPHRRQMPL